MTNPRAGDVVQRRRVRVRGGTLGPFLCWAVVFADIGTSIYYVPGILSGHYHGRSALFVGMTLVVFVLLTIKYSEVAWRYPEGGGVVTVSSRALHPFVGLLGGLFILVDYYLTAALSALSGMVYLSVVAPAMNPVLVHATVIALVVLGLLNLVGIKESAEVSAVFATLAAIGQLAVVAVVALHLGVTGIVDSFKALGHGPALGPGALITGYAASFLAFSGLESIAQISPAIREPRRKIAGRAMALVVLTIAITSPLLTLWSTTLIADPSANTGQYVSLLGARFSGVGLGDYVAISGSLLLVFASNTAVIGAYHVFLALTRMGFLPRPIELRNRLRTTPHWAILLAVALPIAVVIAVDGNQALLGDLYAFGLLGAFVLTCVGLDFVRWRENRRARSAGFWIAFVVGVLTTVAVLVAWCVNLVAKPAATEFGGGLTVLGLIIGFATYRYHHRGRPAVFPIPYRRASDAIIEAFRRDPADVLVVLPLDPQEAPAVIATAVEAGAGRSVVFLYRGRRPKTDHAGLREIDDPYLQDYDARDAFARAEHAARRGGLSRRRYVYVSGNHRRDVLGEAWREMHPSETVAAEIDFDFFPPIAVDRVRREKHEDQTVLHMFTARSR